MFPPTSPAGDSGQDLAAEGALAAIGLEPWLRATPKFGVQQRARSSGMGKRIGSDILKFLSGDQIAVGPVHPITWKDANALLYPEDQAMEQRRAEGLTRAVRDPRLAMAIQNVATRALTYLQGKLPRIVIQSLAGDRTVKPSALDWARFRDVWEVASNPEVVLRALAEGSLTPDQVETVQALYPSLYSAITQEAVNQVITMRAKRARWTLSPVKERLLATLRQMEAGKLELGADIQALYAGKGVSGQPAPGPAPPPSSKSLKTNTASRETPGQRAEEPVM